MKHLKNFSPQFLLLGLMFSQVLTSCAQNMPVNSSSSSDEKVSLGNGMEVAEAQELSINSRCVGCSKCVRTDPAHFSMNFSEHKAQVASQENLHSSSLERAIDHCPVQAIQLS